MSIPSISTYTLPLKEEIFSNKVNWKINRKQSALLIHDMQKYFIQFYGTNNPLIQAIINNIAKIADFCRQNDIPVFYTAQPSAQTEKERALLNDMWGSGITNFPHLQDIIPQLAPQNIDYIVDKYRYSAFQRNDFEESLKKKGRGQLIICGVYSNIGCLTTAIDAFMRDIRPFMVMDAVADFSRNEHISALNYMASKVGMVISTEQMLSIS